MNPPNPAIPFHLKSTSLSQLGVVFNTFLDVKTASRGGHDDHGKNFLGFWSLFVYCSHHRKLTAGNQSHEGLVSGAFPVLSGDFQVNLSPFIFHAK